MLEGKYFLIKAVTNCIGKVWLYYYYLQIALEIKNY